MVDNAKPTRPSASPPPQPQTAIQIKTPHIVVQQRSGCKSCIRLENNSKSGGEILVTVHLDTYKTS
ncbi:hypothetical protein J6590_013518 [Homalodisca vitripennis]|nr:hypothetical protein J6590_013518 [Homalodisca vitripennis]